MNGDGIPDVVASYAGNNAFSILRGRGDGSFASALEYPAPGGPRQFSLGDLDGDGQEDVVYRLGAEPSAPDGGLLGPGLLRGGLPFGAAELQAAWENHGIPWAADFDGDGRLDVLELASGDILFWKGRGDGTLEAPRVAVPGFGFGGAPFRVVDLDRDGRPDVVVSNTYGLNVLRGRGDGTFEPPVVYVTSNQGAPFALGDLNGDGRLDQVAGNPGNVSSLLVAVLGLADGGFGPPISTDTTYQSGLLETGDFDRDGRVDVLSLDYFHGLNLYPGRGDGTFAPAVRVAAFDTADGFGTVIDLAVADLNRDGLPDAVVLRKEEACVILARP